MHAALGRVFGGLSPFNDPASSCTTVARHYEAARRYPDLFAGLVSVHLRHGDTPRKDYLAAMLHLGELLSNAPLPPFVIQP